MWGQRPGQLTYYIKAPNIILGAFIFLVHKHTAISIYLLQYVFLAHVNKLYHKGYLQTMYNVRR